jgi:glycosyltransferase involved in cell wall biosynthesis
MKPVFRSVINASAGQPCSVGVLQFAPTQFDDPLFRLAAAAPDIRLTVYYYGGESGNRRYDPEMGRTTEWREDTGKGYRAVYLGSGRKIAFVRAMLRAGHDLLIVSGYNEPITLMAAIGGAVSGVAIGLRSDNVLPAAGLPGRFWALKRILFPLWFRIYATGHPVGENSARYLERFGFSRSRLFWFPYCMDGEAFWSEAEKARQDREKLAAEWGLPPGARAACGVIKFAPREDPLTLIRAALLVRSALPDFVLLLAGDGPLREAVEREAGDELGRGIRLTGYLPFQKLPSLYAASELFVHPATGAWEVSVAEALSCGIPVLAADTVGSALELVVPHQLGILFPHGDSRALAEKMMAIMNDGALKTRCLREGPEVVKGLSPARALLEWRRAAAYVRREGSRS